MADDGLRPSKRERTRARLTQAALDLFERQGFEDTTVAQIVAAADVTEMTFYRHPGKAGPDGGGCSYLAPIRTLAITNGFKLEYDVFLAIGTVSELREKFRSLQAK